MDHLILLTTEIEERLRNPPPGSRIEAARDYGIDLTLLIERLRLTPEERVRDLQRAINSFDKIRGQARQNPSKMHVKRTALD